MSTLAFPDVGDSSTASVRFRELVERFLDSCKRKPIGTDANRIKDWRASKRDLSFDIIDNGLLRGGRREYARAIYLQKAAELIDPIDVDVPPMDECKRMMIEADVVSDRVRNLALVDGQITSEEARTIEETHTDEVKFLNSFVERIRRSSTYRTTRFG
jgi:hypothetical protein